MGARIELTGKTFNRWTVIGPIYLDNNPGRLKWAVRCRCGNEGVSSGYSLKSGQTMSCGCLKNEMASARATTHGMSKHPIFRVWCAMRARCNAPPESGDYEGYSGRGIVVCERWLTFDNFRDDMLLSWTSGMSIERIDVNGNYEPGNCCWLPANLQSKNRRCTVWVETPKGRLTMAEAAKTFGLSVCALQNRINKGWPADKLFSPPIPSRVRKNNGRHPTDHGGVL